MATKTRIELVAQALSNLGVTQAGQTPEIEDADAVDDHVDGVLARLSASDIVTISDDDNIPAELLNTLADILADDAAPEFGQKSNPQLVALAENKIRVMVRGRPTRETLATDYF